MQRKIIIKNTNGEPLFPRTSLDNIVRTTGSTETVGVPYLENGKIPDSFLQATQNIATITGATVNISAGDVKQWALSADGVLSATGTVGKYGEARIIVIPANHSVTSDGNIVMIDGLTPNAVNMCRLQFVGSRVNMYTEDYHYGYTVTVGGDATGAGSLLYGITQSNEQYITFSHGVHEVSLDGATVGRSVNIIGNGGLTVDLNKNNIVSKAGSVAVVGLTLENGINRTTVADPVSNFSQYGSFFTVIGSYHTLSVCGCTMSNAENYFGGAIFISDHDILHVSDCLISGCTAHNMGGAIHINGGTAFISGTTISNCSATNNGGGISVASSNSILVMDNCLFSGCSPTAIGVINNNAQSVNITGCTFATATDGFRNLGTATLTNCVSNCESMENSGTMDFAAENIVRGVVTNTGTVNLCSSSVLDLTGNTNTTVISGGTITVGNGVDDTATVIDVNGSTHTISGTGTTLTNTGILS